MFWNEQLFRKAGIEAFPQTWEEFWDCCDKLQNSGITPLALHTEGTAWAPMLLATAELADSEEDVYKRQHLVEGREGLNVLILDDKIPAGAKLY